MFNKLQIKIVFILFLALSITTGTNFFVGNYMLKSELMNAVTAEAFATGQGLKVQVERLLSYGLELEELTGFDELCVEVVEKNKGIEHASVVDLEGRVLFHSNKKHLGTTGNLPELFAAFKDEKETMIKYTDNSQEFLSFIIPVFNSHNRHVGSVVLDYPKMNIMKPIIGVSYSILVISFVTFLLAILFIGSALSLWITSPLYRLYDATRKIFYNGPEAIQNVNITTKDEIGRLGASFNMMLSRLKETTVSKSYVDNIISSMTDALIVIDSYKKIETVNQAAINLLEYREEELIGKFVDMIFPNLDSILFKGQWVEILKEEGKYKNYETNFITKSGRSIPILLCCSAMKTEEMDVIRVLCTARDITEIKEAEEIMFRQANYDMLTGLANRHYLESQMSEIIHKGELESQPHTFLSLDLDKFKIVNDVCGHHAGDQLMKHLSLIMKQNLRNNDILARLGGDEFGILLRNTDISEGYNIGEGICKVIRDFHFSWEDKLFTLGVSIGAVEINKHNNNIEQILIAADQACYISKEKGGNRVHIFTDADKELSERHEEMNVMASLTKAFEENRFFFNYQPIVSTNTNKDKKWYEVLIRMIDENGYTVQPGAFLPAAQRYNMMTNIDRWVIHHFMSTYQEKVGCLSKGSSIIFNINISGASLNIDSFLDFICDELKKYNVPPEVICFEITETSAVSNFVNSSQFVQKLKGMGCSFALDDFGSGLSSFAYLKYLPVDYIKIDGAFTKNIANDPIDYAMISSINEMAHVMGMKTIAEYVESEEIFNCLRKIKVDYAQGYWLGKPNKLEHYLSKTA